MERLTPTVRDLRQRPGTPPPAGSAATEDGGQRFLDDMSVSEMSDKNPAGRFPYGSPTASAGREREASETTSPGQRRVVSEASRRGDSRPATVPSGRGAGRSSGPSRRRTRGPIEAEPMDSRITIRMTGSERVAVEKRASVLRVKPSTWARAAMLDALDTRRDLLGHLEQASAVPDPSLADAVEQLRRVGVNLNQVLRRKETPDEVLIYDVGSRVDEVRAALGDRTVT